MRVTYNSKRYHRPDIYSGAEMGDLTIANWTAGNSATKTQIDANTLRVTYNAVSSPYVYRNFTVVSGAVYRLQYRIKSDGAAYSAYVVASTGTPAGSNYGSDVPIIGTVDQNYDGDVYILASGTTLTISLVSNATSGGQYGEFTNFSLKRVSTMTHAPKQITFERSGAINHYTAANSSIALATVYSNVGADDNALAITNTGAAYGRASVTYAFPTVAGRQYKASALWIPHEVAGGSIDVGTALHGSQLGTAQKAADLDHATPFFTAGSGLRWNFTNTDDGWTFTNTTRTNSATYVGLTATSGDPWMTKSGLSFSGYENRYVCVWMRRTSAAWNHELQIFYTTAAHATSESYKLSLNVATLAQVASGSGARTMIVFDMWQLTAGGTDWKDNTITGLRFDWCGTNTATCEIDLIAVGNLNPLELTFTATGSSAYLSFFNSNESNAISYYILPHVEQLDSEYTIESSSATVLARRSPELIGEVNEADDGTPWGVVRRIDRGWNVTSDIFAGSQRRDWEEFFNSCLAKESFEFDAYGTAASPDDPIQARLVQGSWSIDRVENSDYWTASFSLVEVSE